MNAAERILDAALDDALRFGLKSVSIDRVARRVGVSRATVYRYFANKDTLVAQMVERELGRMLVRVGAVVQSRTTLEDQIVEGFTAIIHLAREHPLVKLVLTSELESAVRFTEGDSGVFATVRRRVAARIRDHRPHVDADAIAEVLVRVGVTFLFVDDGIKLATAGEARAFARRFLVPMLDGGA